MFFAVSSLFRSLYRFSLNSKPNKKKQVPFAIWQIVRFDRVKIRSGDDKGKVGRVIKVKRKSNEVIVSGVNKRIKF